MLNHLFYHLLYFQLFSKIKILFLTFIKFVSCFIDEYILIIVSNTKYDRINLEFLNNEHEKKVNYEANKIILDKQIQNQQLLQNNNNNNIPNQNQNYVNANNNMNNNMMRNNINYMNNNMMQNNANTLMNNNMNNIMNNNACNNGMMHLFFE